MSFMHFEGEITGALTLRVKGPFPSRGGKSSASGH